MAYDLSYVGQELNWMITKDKPMSVFYRAVSEDIDEFSGQDFGKYVRAGHIIKDVFYLNSPHGRVIYTVFTKPDQRWRFKLYKSLKKSCEGSWSAEQEFLESYLLGYTK